MRRAGNVRGTTGDPQTTPLHYRPAIVPDVFRALASDVTTRIRPKYLTKNFAPLPSRVVLIASMSRGTLLPNTPQSKQRKSALRLSTQTGKS